MQPPPSYQIGQPRGSEVGEGIGYAPDAFFPAFVQWITDTWVKRATDLARARRDGQPTTDLIAGLIDLEPFYLAVADAEEDKVEGFGSTVDLDLTDARARGFWEQYLDEAVRRYSWELSRFGDAELEKIGSAENRRALRERRALSRGAYF